MFHVCKCFKPQDDKKLCHFCDMSPFLQNPATVWKKTPFREA